MEVDICTDYNIIKSNKNNNTTNVLSSDKQNLSKKVDFPSDPYTYVNDVQESIEEHLIFIVHGI